MSLNALEYDKLSRIARATAQIADNSVNSVSLDRYSELRRAFDMMILNYEDMKASRDYWKREQQAMEENRDVFKNWGETLARQFDAKVAELRDLRAVAAQAEAEVGTLRQRAERAEAELAALKASLAQGEQG
ncbi:hypothetical protein [Acidisoma sp. C75]